MCQPGEDQDEDDEGDEDEKEDEEDKDDQNGGHRVCLPVEEGRVDEERFEGDGARNDKKPKQLAAVMRCR